jgi:hypothetical protein
MYISNSQRQQALCSSANRQVRRLGHVSIPYLDTKTAKTNKITNKVLNMNDSDIRGLRRLGQYT